MFGLAHGFSSWQECVVGESFLPPWWPEERKKGGREGGREDNEKKPFQHIPQENVPKELPLTRPHILKV